MMNRTPDQTRRLTVIAQDPSIKAPNRKNKKKREVLLTKVEIPYETFLPGPKGYRMEVIDYDVSTNILYTQAPLEKETDPYGDDKIQKNFTKNFLDNPHFHAQNAFAIAMATLYRFERALGRSVSWYFEYSSHHLKIVPHAFAEPNAYYSREDQGLMFGYFPSSDGMVFTCLSHDIVAHETTHAILDGLRPFYITPSSPDQFAFHEGFADLISLLSVLTSPEIVNFALGPDAKGKRGLLKATDITQAKLKETFLLKVGEQLGKALSGVRGQALRHSIKELEEGHNYLDLKAYPQYAEPHLRGEILVAALMKAYLVVWEMRVKPLLGNGSPYVDRERVVEEGVKASAHLLTMAIRAIDYLPPVDLKFSDYLSALLTADKELCPDDRKYGYRQTLFDACAAYGIQPFDNPNIEGPDQGLWAPPRKDKTFELAVVHLNALKTDPNAAFRWVWENRESLELDERAFTRVWSVRPITRVGPDRYILQETVVEVLQTLILRANELKEFGLIPPAELKGEQTVKVYGGNTLVFDEFGRLKFNIGSGVRSARQNDKIRYLWSQGYYDRLETTAQAFAQLHLHRALASQRLHKEQW